MHGKLKRRVLSGWPLLIFSISSSMQNAEMIRFSQDRESSIKRVAPLSVSDVLAGEEVRAKWISSPRHDRCADVGAIE